jgi:hypothetical protein
VNIFKRIINLGTNKQTDPVYNKHIRFANSVALIVCFFIVQIAALAIYFKQPLLILVYVMHFLTIALVPVFNHWGKRVLAAAWFSSVAILFVSFYAIIFTLDSYNIVFLPMIIFLQFFLFSASEKNISSFSQPLVHLVLWVLYYGRSFLCYPYCMFRQGSWMRKG